MPSPYSDPALQYLRINDFTPGIYRYKRGSQPLAYSSNAPLGSCSHAYRCLARPGIGLVPLPNYVTAQTHTATDASNPVCLSMGSMLALNARGGATGDLVCTILTQVGHPEVKTQFDVTRFVTYAPGSVPPGLGYPTAPLSCYTNSQTTPITVGGVGYAFPFNTVSWPSIDYAAWQDPSTSIYGRTSLTHDPITTCLNLGTGPGKWVTVPGWQTPTWPTVAQSASGNFPLVSAGIATYPNTFYHATRMGIWQIGDRAVGSVSGNWVASDDTILEVSGQLNPTVITNAGTFFPEMGTAINTWGSISTGELVAIYNEGGAILIYGDMLAPTQVFKLPGVQGAATYNKGALSEIGMIYVGADGVYSWNGDNSSQRLSQQIPDDVFARIHQGNGFQTSPVNQSDVHCWGPWVVFPQNWLFDTRTQGWWLVEDPTVINFQVYAGTGTSLFASPGIAYANAGATATLLTYMFNMATTYQNSYYWVSSPLPVTQDALVSIQLVEIVASNPTSQPATIVVQPGVPAGQTPLAQQNPNQPLTFTVPPTTISWRGSLRSGYTDYNVQLAVTATGGGTTEAPILHELNVGWTQIRTAGVQ